MIVGYRIPGSSRGGTFTLPDFCWGKVSEDDANLTAERLRLDTGQEPAWQTVRGKLIRLAKSKINTAAAKTVERVVLEITGATGSAGRKSETPGD